MAYKVFRMADSKSLIPNMKSIKIYVKLVINHIKQFIEYNESLKPHSELINIYNELVISHMKPVIAHNESVMASNELFLP